MHQLTKFYMDTKPRVIAELGVYGGKLTRRILRAVPEVQEYWAIDQYLYLGVPSGGYEMGTMTQEDWDDMHIDLCRMSVDQPRLRVMRAKSIDAARAFPEGYFDAVYIDTDHSWDATREDILAFLPLVKEGGYIGGHDFVYGRKTRAKGHLVPYAVHSVFSKDDIFIVPRQNWMVRVTGSIKSRLESEWWRTLA